MTAYPAWTPASRPGIIPLHPLGFGTILGRSFAALRHNPRVLLGFALGVQTLAYLLVLLGVAGAAWASFSRLDTVRFGTDDYNAVLAGSIALTAVAGFVLGIAAGAIGVVVQGVVVSEVASAVLAEKLALKVLWRRVKPVAWRLIGYAFLLSTAVVLLLALVVGGLVALGFAALPVAVGLGVLVVLAAIPLALWLSTKLLLVPATIILEQATIRAALGRSWTLIRGRFWPALGIVVIVSFVFGAVGQVVGVPFSFLSGGLSTILSPTGEPDTGAVIAIVVTGILTQVVTLAIQSVAVVVQSTATALIYIDCRMRREGLDLDLLTYVERRDGGVIGLADPYREHIGRDLGPRPSAPGFAGYPPGFVPPPPYGQPPYGQPPYGQPPYGQPPYGQPPYGTPGPYPAAPPLPGYAPAPDRQPAPAAPAAPPASPDTRPAPTRWTAPGQPGDGAARESPER